VIGLGPHIVGEAQDACKLRARYGGPRQKPRRPTSKMIACRSSAAQGASTSRSCVRRRIPFGRVGRH
jgi:hypothetical protein